MSKAAPWSIKGIDYDVRIAAKEAAKRAGMTLGEWLNSVISEQASEMGLDPEDLDEDDRNLVISSRLEQLARQDQRFSRRTDRLHPARAIRSSFARDDDDFEMEYRAPPQRLQQYETRYDRQTRSGNERLVEEAVREIERRGLNNAPRNSRGGDDLHERLAKIEAAVEHRSGSMEDKTMRRALSRIEARMEALAENVGHDDANVSDLDRKLAEIAARLNAPADASRPVRVQTAPAPEAFEGYEDPAVKMVVNNSPRALRERMSGDAGQAIVSGAMRPSELARIEAKLNLLLSRDTPAPQDSLESPHTFQPARRPVSEAVAEIHMRQKALDGSSRKPVTAAGSSAAHQAVASVRNDLQAIASRLDELKRDNQTKPVAAPVVQPPAQPYPGLEQLRAQMDEVNRAVANLAPKNSITSLESAVRELGERVANSRQEGVRESILQPIEGLLQDLHKSLNARNANPQLNSMEKELQDIGRRLEHLSSGRERVDTGRIDEIYQQTSSIRDLLTAAVARPMPVEAIEKQINALGKRIDAIATRGSSPVGIAAVTENVEEIRATMREAYPAEELTAIQDKLENLSSKFELAMANIPAMQNFDDMAQRIDAVQRTIFQRLERPTEEASQTSRKLEGLMREIRDRLDIATHSERQDNSSTIEAQIKSLSEKFDASQRQIDTTHLSTLEQHLRSLIDKIDSGSTNQEQPVFAALENQVKAIANRLDNLDLAPAVSPGATLDILGNIEQNVAGLLNQLEDTRLTAADAAESAARSATQNALEELLKNGVLTGNQSQEARELIAREIANLRSSQDATDRRTHATLSAVHETLEKVVDRLALLEDNIETVQAAPVATPAAMPEQVREAATLASGPAPLFQRRPASEEIVPEAAKHGDWDTAIARSKNKVAAADHPAPTVLPPMPASSVKPSSSSPSAVNSKPAADQTVFTKDAKAVANDSVAKPASPAPLDISDLKIDPEASALWSDDAEDELIEPGLGSPAYHPAGKSGPLDHKQDASEAKASTSFIAAARRASIAAQAEAEAASAQQSKRRKSGEKSDSAFAEARARAAAAASSLSSALERNKKNSGNAAAEPATKPAKAESARSSLRSRKVLLSLSLAAAVLVLGTLQFMRSSGAPSAPEAPKASTARPQGKPAADSKAPAVPQRGASLNTGFSPIGTPVLPTGRSSNAPGVDSRPVASISASGAPQDTPKPASNNLHEAAASGDARAEYELAVRHIDGRAVAKDPARAIVLLKKAADQGLAPAQYRLASIYEKGLGTAKNPKEAFSLYEAAAKAGNVRAMHNLAVLAADGSAGKADYATAAKWFLSAAEHDVRDSQYNLAILYARGLGIPRNLVESYKWFSIAAKKGDTDAASKRDQVARRLSPGELTRAREVTEKFRPRKALEAANSVAPPTGGWSLKDPQVSGSGSDRPAAKPHDDGNIRKRPKVSAL